MLPNIFPKRQMQPQLDIAQLMAMLGQQDAPQPQSATPFNANKLTRDEGILQKMMLQGEPQKPPPANAQQGGAAQVPGRVDLGAAFGDTLGPASQHPQSNARRQPGETLIPGLKLPFIDSEENMFPGGRPSTQKKLNAQAQEAPALPAQDAGALLGEQRETPFPDFMARGAGGKPLNSFQPQGPSQDDGSGADFNALVQASAKEAVQKGVQSPEQAEEYLRVEFQDDPYIESALQDAKNRYEDARRRSAEPPSVLDFIGYTLASLAFGNPMAASEIFGRRGEKREDEARALDQLMGVQGMKVQDRQRKEQMANQTAMRMEDIARMFHQDQAKMQMRQQERGEDMQFQGLRSGRSAALQQLNQLRNQQSYEMDPQRKAALQRQIEALQKRVQWFNQNLGEPGDDEIGMDVNRLLGLG